MIRSPKVLLLDEPTSGLDAASAYGVVDAIKTLAVAKWAIVICSIHQPSSKIFSRFTHTMLLSRGHLVYTGRTDQAVSYFAQAGYPLPRNTNPAEHLLDIINPEFTSPDQVKSLIQAWDTKTGEHHTAHAADERANAKPPGDGPRFSLQSFSELLKRHVKLSLRDPSLYTGRMVAFFLTGVLISTVYLRARSRSLDAAVERAVMEGWYFAVPSLLSVAAVLQTGTEAKMISHEVRLGLVNPTQYIAVRCIVELPWMVVLAVSTLAAGGLAISAFNVRAFGLMIVVYASMLLAFEALAQTTALMFSKAAPSMLVYVLVWFAAFLFSEIWVASDNVIRPLQLLFYASPFRQSLRAFVYLDFHDTVFKCGTTLSLFSYVASTQECAGTYSGDKVLDTLRLMFPVFTSDVDLGWCIAATLVISIALKAVFCLCFARKLTSHSTIVPATKFNGSKSGFNKFVVWSSCLFSAAAIIGPSIWMAFDETKSNIGADECLLALKSSKYDLRDHSSYDAFFDDDSVMTLAEGKFCVCSFLN